MGALSTKNPTLMDVARRTDPKGKIATIVEILNDTNEILDDMTFLECNNGTTHVTTVRTGIPNGTWRKLYGFVQPTKSTSKQVQDGVGMLEARSQIDADLYEMNGNSKDWRMSEEAPFMEGLNQDVAETLFYGDTDVYPERFMGLAPRFNSYQTTDKTKSSYNVIHGGGSGSDNTSVWFVVWGPNTMHGLYPKGSKAGLVMEDLGKQEISDSSGGRMTVVESKYKWKPGLAVRDWRSIVRIANLDVSALQANTASADLFELFTSAYHRQKGRKLGRAVIYCNSTVMEAMDKQAQDKTNLHLTYADVDGKKIMSYRGIPIRECEALLDTEATVPSA